MIRSTTLDTKRLTNDETIFFLFPAIIWYDIPTGGAHTRKHARNTVLGILMCGGGVDDGRRGRWAPQSSPSPGWRGKRRRKARPARDRQSTNRRSPPYRLPCLPRPPTTSRAPPSSARRSRRFSRRQ